MFNGDRLKFARTYRGMSAQELAEKIEVSRQSISQFENYSIDSDKNSKPSIENIENIAQELKFPVEFFFQKEKENIKIENTYFRALLSSKKKEKQSQINKAVLITVIYDILQEYLEFPDINIPVVQKENLSDQDISNAARELRDLWNIENKPIKDIIFLMENNGLVVTALPTNTEEIDAFTQYIKIENKEYMCVVLENEKKSACRRQFSAAHELGHIILHANKINMNEIERSEFREIERQANLFASELLLPEEEFKKDLIMTTSLKSYEILKRKWHVSILAMMMRACNLNIITQNQFQYLMKQYTIKNYRKHEPLDNIIEIPQPQTLKRAIEILLTNNIFTPDEFLDELKKREWAVDYRDVEELLNLEEGILKPNYIQKMQEVKLRLIKGKKE